MAMSLKSIVSGFVSVICGGVLLMPLLVQPDPVSAEPHAALVAQAKAVLPDEDCAPGASADTLGTSGNSRWEHPCPRVPLRLAQQTSTVAR